MMRLTEKQAAKMLKPQDKFAIGKKRNKSRRRDYRTLKGSCEQTSTGVVVILPLRLDSIPNINHSNWFVSAGRRKRQRELVQTWFQYPQQNAVSSGWSITLTRIAPKQMDGDNLQASFKSIRDEVAAQLGFGDDNDKRLTWIYGQEKPSAPKTYGIRIDIVKQP